MGATARENGATRLLGEPLSGRVFRTERTVRLAEADAAGRLRLDAAARVLQDVATDDSHDLGTLRARAWVVRRTVIEQHVPARYNERLALSTFCSGLGTRWAERRISMTGDRGGRLETVTLWVHLDPGSGRPARLPDEFVAVYSEPAGGREVTARQLHEPVVPEDDDVHTMPWWPRVTDLDVLDHVNNAASWEVLEQSVDRAVERGLLPDMRKGPIRAEVEFRDPIDAEVVRSAMPMTVAYCVRDEVLDVTLWSIDGTTAHVTARLAALATDPVDDDGGER
jgi:acyl-ACP thioesterase